jgi:hypothetical protein
MSTKTITGEALVWISKHSSIGPGHMPKPEDVSDFVFTTTRINKKHWLGEGYTEAGTAIITVNLLDENGMIESKANALREEIKAVNAEAHAKTVRLEAQLQELLAIAFDANESVIV